MLSLLGRAFGCPHGRPGAFLFFYPPADPMDRMLSFVNIGLASSFIVLILILFPSFRSSKLGYQRAGLLVFQQIIVGCQNCLFGNRFKIDAEIVLPPKNALRILNRFNRFRA